MGNEHGTTAEIGRGARTSGVRLLGAVLAAVVLVGVGGLAIYHFTVSEPLKRELAAQREEIARLTGMLTPAGEQKQNQLDAAYTDSDGDLVADVPADAAKQVDPEVIRFSYVASEDDAGYREAFADFMAHLSKATGKKVEYVGFEATEDHLSALKAGKVDVTAFSTGGVPVAVCGAGFVPVACLGSDKGPGKYEMEIVVRADSGINSVKDLAGKDLTLTDAGSNSGYKAPLVLIKREFGLVAGRDYGVRYSGGQEQSIKGLADGTYQAAAVASDILEREIAAGVIKGDQVKVIYKSEGFPTAAFGYRHDLKPELAGKVREALVGFKFGGTSAEKMFGGAGEDRLVPIQYKEDWSLVRGVDEAVGSKYVVK